MNMTLLSTHFMFLFNRDEAKPKKLPIMYFVFDALLGLSEMMFGDILGDMNCIYKVLKKVSIYQNSNYKVKCLFKENPLFVWSAYTFELVAAV